MNYIDPKTQYRFEKLDFDNNAEANVDEKKDQEYSGGVGIRFQSKNENPMQKGGSTTDMDKMNDLVVPFSLAYRVKKPNKRTEQIQSPTVIGGELFDEMFFKVGNPKN